MENNQILFLLKELKELFEKYEILYIKFVDQITPEFPTKNKDVLEKIERQIASCLTNLTPIILRYSSSTKRKYLYGNHFDIYREAIGWNEFQRKIDFINESLQDLDKMISLVEEEEISVKQQSQINKTMSPKKSVKAILKKYKFPELQKRLIKKLSDTLPKDTGTLKTEVDTKDLHSLKRDTLAKIKGYGLNNIISIKSYKEGFKHFYRLVVNSAGF